MVEKVLATQLAQEEEPSAAHVPAEHAWHVIAFLAPSMGVDVPDGQSVHALAPAYEYVPGVQMSTRISSLIDCVMVTCCCECACVSSAESWMVETGLSLMMFMSTATCWCVMGMAARMMESARKMCDMAVQHLHKMEALLYDLTPCLWQISLFAGKFGVDELT